MGASISNPLIKSCIDHLAAGGKQTNLCGTILGEIQKLYKSLTHVKGNCPKVCSILNNKKPLPGPEPKLDLDFLHEGLQDHKYTTIAIISTLLVILLLILAVCGKYSWDSKQAENRRQDRQANRILSYIQPRPTQPPRSDKTVHKPSRTTTQLTFSP